MISKESMFNPIRQAIDFVRREYLIHDNFNRTGRPVDAMLDALHGDPRF
jgi:hypothetical protein